MTFRHSLAASCAAMALALAGTFGASSAYAQSSGDYSVGSDFKGSGVYLRGNAGLGVVDDVSLSGGIDSSLHPGGIQGESGLAATLGVGYDFGNNWRLELDGDTHYSDMGSISGVPNTFAKLRTNSLMVNALYDFAEFGRFEPYVGAGLGIIQGDGSFSAHDFAVGQNFGANPVCTGARTDGQAYSCDINDKDNSFGWQLLAGLGVGLSDRLTWDTHYTYQDAGSFDFDGVRSAFPSGLTAAAETELEDVTLHSLVTGLRYRFGGAAAPRPVAVTPPPPIRPRTFTCIDGSVVTDRALCPPPPAPPPPSPPPPPQPQTFACADGTIVTDLATCPRPAPVQQSFLCADNATVVSDLSQCPTVPIVLTPSLNACTTSNVAIFNVPSSANFKPLTRLGTMPEFGDSHALSPSQFYDKLNARFNANKTDHAYLNYLARSMGYSGWRDINASMFSEDVIPVGTRGILGLGEQHHYEYKIIPSNDRDRQAFRIQSANGQVVHFMKTCGNYFYGCQ